MLQAFGTDIWLADGPEVTAAAGFHYPTRMAVARLDGGGLWLWSPVALTAGLRDAVAALGPVNAIVGPNALHHLALGDWAGAFPGARLYAALGLAEKCADLDIHAVLNAAPPADWAGDFDQVIFANRIADEAVFFHRPSGTALFTDLLQQMPKGWYSGWRALVARADLMTGDKPQVPRKFRLATPRRTGRAALAKIAAWPVKRVVMAHGTPVTNDARGFLAEAFAWLDPAPFSG